MNSGAGSSTQPCKTKNECGKEDCPCDGAPKKPYNYDDERHQDFIFGLSETVHDTLTFVYIIAMSVIFQANRTEWRDKVFSFFADTMQNYLRAVKEVPDQPQQFYEMSEARAKRYLNAILDAYRTLEGTMPASIRDLYEEEMKAQQERQIQAALEQAHQILLNTIARWELIPTILTQRLLPML